MISNNEAKTDPVEKYDDEGYDNVKPVEKVEVKSEHCDKNEVNLDSKLNQMDHNCSESEEKVDEESSIEQDIFIDLGNGVSNCIRSHFILVVF